MWIFILFTSFFKFWNSLVKMCVVQVKLADVLGKYILPVSFLTDWPPRCLAIQFATTQYISCRKQQQQQQLEEHGNSQGELFLLVVTETSITEKGIITNTYIQTYLYLNLHRDAYVCE